jgi:hypothetical protein
VMSSNASEARKLWKLMSSDASDASEARRLRPDQRNRSKDYDISNHKYTCWDEQALHFDTNVAIAYSVGTLTSASSYAEFTLSSSRAD